MTASLSLNYRAPTRADQVRFDHHIGHNVVLYPAQFIVIRTSLVEAKGRKTMVKGQVEDLEGTLLVEAKYVLPFLQI